MTYLVTLQINLFMCLLLALTLAVAARKLDLAKAENRLFLGLILSILVLLVLEIASVVLNARFNAAVRTSPHLVVWNRLVNTTGFALVPVPPLLLLLFLHKWVRRPVTPALRLLYALPVLCNTALAVLSYGGGVLFNISQANEYSRGAYFIASPAVSYLFFLLNFLFLLKNRHLLRAQEIVLLLSAIAIPAVAGVFQLAFFVYLTIWNSWAISAVVLFICLLVCRSEMDELTRMGNRRMYRDIIFKARRMKDLRISIAMLDLDGLKQINDRFGHKAGDQAITVLADGLQAAFGQDFRTMRFGGDEFAVVHFSNDPARLDQGLRDLEAYLERYNASSGKPYRIGFSHGLAVSGEGESVDELLHRCDQMMYERKRRKFSGA